MDDPPESATFPLVSATPVVTPEKTTLSNAKPELYELGWFVVVWIAVFTDVNDVSRMTAPPSAWPAVVLPVLSLKLQVIVSRVNLTKI